MLQVVASPPSRSEQLQDELARRRDELFATQQARLAHLEELLVRLLHLGEEARARSVREEVRWRARSVVRTQNGTAGNHGRPVRKYHRVPCAGSSSHKVRQVLQWLDARPMPPG